MDGNLDSIQTFGLGSRSSLQRGGRRYPEPGDRLGESKNFRLVRLLGEGGMGQAWLAEEIARNKVLRPVVCKLLPADVQTDPHELQKVEALFQLTRTLNHTNICPLYGMEFDPEFGWFFVMGCAEGVSLREWICTQQGAEYGLPPKMVLKFLRPLASALDYAHRKRVIHRDIKPENIMFSAKDDDSDLWIIDFGIAAQIHETRSRTSAASESSGTPHYMAPEQFLGELQDARTDQYALGVLAYEILSGRRPFMGNIHALAHQIVYVAPKQIQTLTPEANAVLQRVLAKRQGERFSSCSDFVNALEKGLFVPSAVPKPWGQGRNGNPGQTQIPTENVWNRQGQTLRPTAPAPSPNVQNGSVAKAPKKEPMQTGNVPSVPYGAENGSQAGTGPLELAAGLGRKLLTALGLCLWMFAGVFVLFVWHMLMTEIFSNPFPCLLACLAGGFLLVWGGFALLGSLEKFPGRSSSHGITESLISITFAFCFAMFLLMIDTVPIESVHIGAAFTFSQSIGLFVALVWHRGRLWKLRRASGTGNANF